MDICSPSSLLTIVLVFKDTFFIFAWTRFHNKVKHVILRDTCDLFPFTPFVVRYGQFAVSRVLPTKLEFVFPLGVEKARNIFPVSLYINILLFPRALRISILCYKNRLNIEGKKEKLRKIIINFNDSNPCLLTLYIDVQNWNELNTFNWFCIANLNQTINLKLKKGSPLHVKNVFFQEC